MAAFISPAGASSKQAPEAPLGPGCTPWLSSVMPIDHHRAQSRQAHLIPTVVLHGVVPLLSVADARIARLVCKEWAVELAASVDSVHLPHELWQVPSNRQKEQLRRLISTYGPFEHATLGADSSQHIHQQSLLDTAAALSCITALRSITIRKLGPSISCWTSILRALEVLPLTLTTLTFTDVRLPGPEGLDALMQLTTIQHLTLSSNCSNKLQQQHISAIGHMQQLHSLKLGFRTMNGSLLEPLLLDDLGNLTSLKHLEIRYTGMSELSTGVCFASDELLSGCKALSSLIISRIPISSLKGLFKLQQLTQLTLVLVGPLSELQARSLALCTQLKQLHLDNLPLELLPHLAALTALTNLQVEIGHPTHGQDMPAGTGLPALRSLSNLVNLSLAGPVLVCQEDVQLLSSSWQQLKSLRLSATLPDGTSGFAGFRGLESLQLEPWTGRFSRSSILTELGGGPEDAHAASIGRGLVVCEQDLPEGLRELTGQDLAFRPQRVEQFVSRHLSSMAQNPSRKRGLTSLKLTYSPDATDCQPPQLPSTELLLGLQCLEIQHPHVTGQQIAAALAGCSSSLRRLSIYAADSCSQLSKHLIAIPYLCTAAQSHETATCCIGASKRALSHPVREGSSAVVGSSSGKEAGVHWSSFGCAATAAAVAVAAAAPMYAGAWNPLTSWTALTGIHAMLHASVCAALAVATALACCRGRQQGKSNNVKSITAWLTRVLNLESLGTSSIMLKWQSIGSQLYRFRLCSSSNASQAPWCSDVLGFGCWSPCSPCSGLSNMGQGLNKGQGLAVLGLCRYLEEVDLRVGDRILGSKVRNAICSLPNLQQLSVAVATDCPAAVARDLGLWVSGLKQLRSVNLGIEGPGAGNVLQGLVEHVSGQLPVCQVSMLKPSSP